MKKILIIVVLAFVFGLVGCASNGNLVADGAEKQKSVAKASRKSCPKITGSRVSRRC